MSVIGSNIAVNNIMMMVTNTCGDLLEEFDKSVEREDVDYGLLDIMHHLTSGFKALQSNYAYFGIDEVR